MSHLHIFILIDALGWELIRERPFLPDFLPCQQPVPTLLGFSSGIIPAILTGRTPAENGMWNLVYFDPERSPFRAMRKLGSLPGLLDNRVGRRLLTEIGRRILDIGSNFDVSVPPQTLPWFNWAEGRNIYARGGIPGQNSIFDQLHDHGIGHKIYSYKDPLTDAEIIEHAAADIASGPETVYFLYLSELDMFLHTHRGSPDRIATKLAWYEAALTRVRDFSALNGLRSEHLRIIDPGVEPRQPSSPKVLLNTIAGSLLAACIAVAWLNLMAGVPRQKPTVVRAPAPLHEERSVSSR